MTTLVRKEVKLSRKQAARLEELAEASSLSEDSLVEQALDLLFREHEQSPDSSPSKRRNPFPIDAEQIVSVHSVPIDWKWITAF